MNYFLPLILGFTAASIGVAPPGLLNMTAAKVSAVDGRNRALIFALGASVTVLFQTYVAVLFAKFIDRNPDVVILLQEVGLFIFIGLTGYFFWAGKKKKKTQAEELKIKSKTSRFFLGMLLSFLNLLPIPYYVFLSVWFSRKGWFFFNQSYIWLFVLGTVVGSFLMFYLYILFFKKRETTEPSFLMKNGNYIIGTVTGIISVVTLIKILKS
ncbi:LysE family transporter [Flavobacterium suncheonense]|uniref:Lysine transporter LysE n=1 Tax=Flavobacterium suncheonense GH29-5 = DSM 17707 TaxID=1121899 RepID=A0A0A2MG89_9FLAO|nr:LysE family transporter [Flavobacterium suncheonense]KGO90483.1 lysine transporter LysE [Flavobacterium suncheonense GH29-5 = DSM 17707]